jgi:hypothetical protein
MEMSRGHGILTVTVSLKVYLRNQKTWKLMFKGAFKHAEDRVVFVRGIPYVIRCVSYSEQRKLRF